MKKILSVCAILMIISSVFAGPAQRGGMRFQNNSVPAVTGANAVGSVQGTRNVIPPGYTKVQGMTEKECNEKENCQTNIAGECYCNLNGTNKKVDKFGF